MKTKMMMLAAVLGVSFGCFAQESKPERKAVEPGKILIAYYSWSGNTKYAAETIRKITGGTLFEIKPAVPYPTEYRACVDQARKEIRAKFKPELSTKVDDIGKYDVIFVGSPNWIGTMAPPVAAFLTSYDLKDKTVVPFFTHGSGGMQNCEKDVRELCGKSNVLKAAAFQGSSIRQSDARIEQWVRSVIALPEKK